MEHNTTEMTFKFRIGRFVRRNISRKLGTIIMNFGY